PGEPLRERVLRGGIRHRRRETGLVAGTLEGQKLVPEPVDLRSDAGRGSERGIAACRAKPTDRAQHPRLDIAPDAVAPEVVLVGTVDGGDRDLCGGERR